MRNACLVVAVVLLVACAGKPRISAESSVSASHIKTIADGELILASPALHGKIALLNPKTRQLGQLKQAEVALQNTSEDRFTIEYRFQWFDTDKFAVSSLATWHRLTLSPGELRAVQSLGKTPKASNFHFTVRLPDDVFIEQLKGN